MRVSPHVVPPSGFHTIEPDGTRIDGHSLDNLLQQVTSYRINNGLPIGNPEQDVTSYLCASYPANCTAETTDLEAEARDFASPGGRSDIDSLRLNQKLLAAQAGKTKLETRETATARSNVCLACPGNVQPSQFSSCAPCLSELDRQAVLIRQNNPIPPNLGLCNRVLHDNRASVYMPDELLERSRRRLDEAPSHCWLRPSEDATTVAE